MDQDAILAAEQAELDRILDTIHRETDKLEGLTGLAENKVRDVIIRVEEPSFDGDIALQLFLSRAETLFRLYYARHSAYFARLRFKDLQNRVSSYAIGRWGVYDPVSQEQMVIDWRAPLANLYYAGDVGPVSYVAPDGEIHGELLLKRMVTVQEDKVLHLYDAGVVGQESWIQQVLDQTSGERLHEIVTTIQTEQNTVIRMPMERHLIVEGVAGSGKTSIALHRIAYLLYRYRDRLRPQQVLLIAPSPLFLSYIGEVLPELGVEQVRQTTFEGLVRNFMGKALPKLAETKEQGAPDPETVRFEQIKGSLSWKAELEQFLREEEERMLPREDLRFGGSVVMTSREIRQLFLNQLSSWPLTGRIREACKPLQRKLSLIQEKMQESYEKMARDRLELLLQTLPDGPERRERATKLLASRDARLKEIDEKGKAFLKAFQGLFPDLSPLAVYRRFLETRDADLCRYTGMQLDKKRITGSDLAPLLRIFLSVQGIGERGVQHIVIDECQDLSPFQVALLKDLYKGATFTMVGDLMQGIHTDTGMAGYEDVSGPVFGGNVEMASLSVSYRSTAEIVELANRIAEGNRPEGVPLSLSVDRHGKMPVIQKVGSETEQLREITATLQAWQAQGYKTVALLTVGTDEAKRLQRKLAIPECLGTELPILQATDTDYRGGAFILPGGQCKGMEFDAVLICDASDKAFPPDEWHARLLYVFVTRPLHEIKILYRGRLTSLLPVKN